MTEVQKTGERAVRVRFPCKIGTGVGDGFGRENAVRVRYLIFDIKAQVRGKLCGALCRKSADRLFDDKSCVVLVYGIVDGERNCVYEVAVGIVVARHLRLIGGHEIKARNILSFGHAVCTRVTEPVDAGGGVARVGYFFDVKSVVLVNILAVEK